MTYEQILQAIRQRDFKPVYVLHGEEPFFIDRIAQEIEQHVLGEAERAFNQTILYGKDVDHKAVLDQARRFPMMSPLQVLILREAQDMKGLNDLADYVAKPVPSTVMVICHKHKKLDKRGKFAKALGKQVLEFESKRLYDNQLPDWVQGYAKGLGYQMDNEAALMVAEYLGNDLGKIANELDKLALNIKEKGRITLEQVQQHIGINKEYNVFELQSALAHRNVLKCQRIVQYFAANPKASPLVMVLGTLYSFFSKVYVASQLPRKDKNSVAEALKLKSAFFVGDYLQAAQRYPGPKLEQIFALLHEYDLRAKGINNDSTDEGALLRELAYKILH